MVLDVLTGAELNCFSIPAIYHPVMHKFNPLSYRRVAPAEVEAIIGLVNSKLHGAEHHYFHKINWVPSLNESLHSHRARAAG